MFSLKLCLSVTMLLPVLLLVGLCHGYFDIITDDDEDLQCKESEVQCLSNNKSFVTCVNAGSLTLLSTIINCPDGYYCDDSSKTPCVSETVTTSTTTTTSSTTTEETTTKKETTATESTTSTEETIVTESTTSTESTTATEETTTEDTTESSTSSSTVTSTTRKKVARPTSAPTCTTTGLYAAPACNQYYECVQKSFLFIFKKYVAVLYTCDDGYYYDTGYQKCVLASESDCEE